MKKLLFTAALTLGMLTVNAQEEVKKASNDILPKKGDWSISFDAKPALSYVGNIFTSASNEAKDLDPAYSDKFLGDKLVEFVGKVMDTDTQATRYVVGFWSEFSNVSQPGTQLSDASTGVSKLKLVAGMGKEWRRGASKRLQGYYGADALVGLQVDRTTTKNTTYEADGAKRGKEVSTVKSTVSQGITFGVGVRGFAGVEYFITPKIALGAEYNFSTFLSYNPGEKTSSSIDPKPNGYTEPETYGRGGELKWNFGGDSGVGVATLRLAFYF